MKFWTRLLCGVALAAALGAGCKEEATAPAPKAPEATTPAQKVAPPAGQAASRPAGQAGSAPAGAQLAPGQTAQIPPTGLTGKVTETMESAGYTYIKVQAGSSHLWVASSPVQVKVGDTVDVPPGLIMTNFTSKSLNRTFPQIFFVNGVRVNGQGAMPVPPPMPTSGAASQPSGAQPGGEPTSQAAGMPNDRNTAPQIDLQDVKRAEGGQTVAELHSRSKELTGKPIKVRGKVVKYLAGIMGKNWLHVQDGSGDAAQGTHDLTVTTSLPFRRGDTVVVEGKLSTDKDFGQGYFYKVIVEDAVIAIE